MPEIAMITFPIRRADLEYPTENINLLYWAIIGKFDIFVTEGIDNNWFISVDSFTDKRLQAISKGGSDNSKKTDFLAQRFIDLGNRYICFIDTGYSTSDFQMKKSINGKSTLLAYESVDLDLRLLHSFEFDVAGSILKGYRPIGVEKLSVTDTDLASGKIGIMSHHHPVRPYFLFTKVLPNYSELQQPIIVIEYDVIGNGTDEDPIRPNMPEDLVEVSKTDVTPEEWEAIQSNPRGKNGLPLVNRLAVTWGAIDYKGEPTMLCAIYPSTPRYVRKDNILRHIEYAKRRGHKVYKPPRSLAEAKELWGIIRKDRPDMLITENELAYHLIGKGELEPDAIADFYERELINLNRIKDVPEWELERTLKRWENLAERYKRNEAKEKLRRVRRR